MAYRVCRVDFGLWECGEFDYFCLCDFRYWSDATKHSRMRDLQTGIDNCGPGRNNSDIVAFAELFEWILGHAHLGFWNVRARNIDRYPCGFATERTTLKKCNNAEYRGCAPSEKRDKRNYLS